MYVCMHACMYVCIYFCMYVFILTYIYSRIFTYIHTCPHKPQLSVMENQYHNAMRIALCVCVCVYVCVCARVCASALHLTNLIKTTRNAEQLSQLNLERDGWFIPTWTICSMLDTSYNMVHPKRLQHNIFMCKLEFFSNVTCHTWLHLSSADGPRRLFWQSWSLLMMMLVVLQCVCLCARFLQSAIPWKTEVNPTIKKGREAKDLIGFVCALSFSSVLSNSSSNVSHF